MNITQAKQIPLRKLVEHFGGRFSHKVNRGELWYHSPFRPDERTASFKIDEQRNTWHDFARTQKLDAHGDIIDLWTDYHNLPRRNSDAIKQALHYLRGEFEGSYRQPAPIQKTPRIIAKAPRYKIVKQGRIWMDGLRAEIARRNLSLAAVQPYLEQITLEDLKTNKRYYGLGMRNDKGGHEISIPNPFKDECYKTVIGPKAITTIRGNPAKACVFEGFWDGLTWLAMNREKEDMPILYILNSTSMIYEAANKLIEAKPALQQIFLFLDNDKAGEKAQTMLLDLLEPHHFTIGTVNHYYVGYKDLSEARMKLNGKNDSGEATYAQYRCGKTSIAPNTD
jgi:hypothetical protein